MSEQLNSQESIEGQGQLKREIKTRHLTMIAIGGSIGTGLFFASGTTIAQVGPGGSLLAFGVMAVIVYLMMQCLGSINRIFRRLSNSDWKAKMGKAIHL